MRAALVALIIVVALFLSRSDGWATFNCFETPEGARRCACIGADNCREMQNSSSCKSGPECDKSELGAIICSCKAVRTSTMGLERAVRPPTVEDHAWPVLI
jgi:hypothetical protein